MTPLERAQLARERAKRRREELEAAPSRADARARSMAGEIRRRRYPDPSGLIRNHSRKKGAKANWRIEGPVGEVTKTFVEPATLRQGTKEETRSTDTDESDDVAGTTGA